jgi:ABC-2 type transport system permease protein
MKDMPAAAISPPAPRVYHGVNWEGLRTLYLREVRRFWKVGMQTLTAPVVTALLYMLVFVVAVGRKRVIEGVDFGVFIVPGLVMMQILGNAFSNSSSSLLQAKMNGLIGDFLMPPLSPAEQVIGFAAGAATRGIAVGAIAGLAVIPFSHGLGIAHLWAILYFGLGASLVMGLLGIVAAIWSEKFDHIAAVSNFVIMPMTFLSGTFYLVDGLPEPFRTISQFNPFFYLIDGFRYGFIGAADGSIAIGVSLTAALIVGLTALCWWMFRTGYKMKT